MATPAKPPTALAKSTPPNRTLYCKNLDDKINKNDLKANLYMLFSTFGPILDIVAVKTPKMRGQAHVVFRDVEASTQAMRALQGFEFLGKAIQISYAKSKSDTIAKLDGTFKLPVKEIPEAQQPAMTSLQQKAFGSAPPAKPAEPESQFVPAPVALPASTEEATKGVKRGREEESEPEDVQMEVDDDEDEDAEMDVSDSE